MSTDRNRVSRGRRVRQDPSHGPRRRRLRRPPDEPDRVYFSERGETKLDLTNYYLAVGPGIVNALRDRPCMLHRFPKVTATRSTRNAFPPGRLPGSRQCGCTSPATACTPTSSASSAWPTSSGPSRCRPSSSTRGTPAGPTPRSRTSGASTSTRCRGAATTRCGGPLMSRTRSSTSSAPGWPRPPAAGACTSTSGSSPSTASRTCGAPPGLRAGGRAPAARRRHDGVVAQGPLAPRPLRRLQPERSGPHHRGRLQRPRQFTWDGVGSGPVGRGRRLGA